jgi:hypothetical protein
MTAWQPVARHRSSKVSGGPMRPVAGHQHIAIMQGGPRESGFAHAGAALRELVELASVQPVLRPPQRGDDMLPDAAAIAAALDDLQVAALTNGLAAEDHARLTQYTTPTRRPLATDVMPVSFLVPHFRPIFVPSPENRKNPPFSFRKRRQKLNISPNVFLASLDLSGSL